MAIKVESHLAIYMYLYQMLKEKASLLHRSIHQDFRLFIFFFLPFFYPPMFSPYPNRMVSFP